MKTPILCSLCLLLTSAYATADDAQKGAKKDAKPASVSSAKLIGKWTYESGARGGKEVGKERLAGTVTFTKETVSLPAGPDSKFVMKFKLDLKTKPVAIDLSIQSGPVPEGSAKGIIKIEKGKLFLCYDPANGKRPKEFKSTEDNGCFLFVLSRKPKGDK